MTILCDIGGTYIRFAIGDGGAPKDIQKYSVADFADLQTALMAYCNDKNIDQGGDLAIATAGYEDQGVWKFVNQNTWQIDPKDLKNAEWNITIILNDFEAATLSLPALQDTDKTILKDSSCPNDTLCLIGPGTGLGLGYLRNGMVHKTHGGHFPAAAITDEQARVIQTIAAGQDTIVVFENIVSGPGLQKLRDLYDEATALRLFHEFFGLFAATAVVAGHAYGGLYLTGGVLAKLIESDAFRFENFEEFFCFNAVDSVSRDLSKTPIIYITDPYPALMGLLNA